MSVIKGLHFNKIDIINKATCSLFLSNMIDTVERTQSSSAQVPDFEIHCNRAIFLGIALNVLALCYNKDYRPASKLAKSDQHY